MEKNYLLLNFHFSRGKPRYNCKCCQKECNKIYREENRGKIKAYTKVYKQKNREKLRAYTKIYRQKNKEKIRKKKKGERI